MEFDDVLKSKIEAAIIDRFEPGLITELKLQEIEVLEDEEEIRLVFSIVTDADPEKIGKGFFGLTDKVRQALGKSWQGYFPILQSEISDGIAA